MKDMKEAYFEGAYNRVKEVKKLIDNVEYESINPQNIVDYIVLNCCSYYSSYSEDAYIDEITTEGNVVVISPDDDSKNIERFNSDDYWNELDFWRICLPKTKFCMEIIRAYYGDIKDFSKETWEDIKYYGISKSCATMLNKFEKQGKIDIIAKH